MLLVCVVYMMLFVCALHPVYVCASEQLAEVADTKDQVFPVKDGFHALRGIVNSVSTPVCALLCMCAYW